MNQLLHHITEAGNMITHTKEGKEKAIVAFYGLTTSGKSSSIASLTKQAFYLLTIWADKEKGRSRITIGYHFVYHSLPEGKIVIEQVVVNMESLHYALKKYDKDKSGEKEVPVDQSIKFLKKFGVTAFTGSETDKEGFKAHYEAQGELLVDAWSEGEPEQFRALVNGRGVEKYISKIVVAVEANEYFQPYLEESDLDLTLMDCMGLGDMDTEENIKLQTARLSAQSMGIDHIDGVVFFALEGAVYPGFMKEYQEVMHGAFSHASTHLFLTKNTNITKLLKSELGEDGDLEDVEDLYYEIRSDENEDICLEDLEDAANCAYEFLESMQLMHKDNKGGMKVSGTNKPLIPSLLPIWTRRQKDVENWDMESREFQVYQMALTSEMIHALEGTLEYKESQKAIDPVEVAEKVMKKWEEEYNEVTKVDFARYNLHPNSSDAPHFFRPKPTDLSKEYIERLLKNKETYYTGPRGGITGSEYAHTLVLCRGFYGMFNSYYGLLETTFGSNRVEWVGDFPCLERDLEETEGQDRKSKEMSHIRNYFINKYSIIYGNRWIATPSWVVNVIVALREERPEEICVQLVMETLLKDFLEDYKTVEGKKL